MLKTIASLFLALFAFLASDTRRADATPPPDTCPAIAFEGWVTADANVRLGKMMSESVAKGARAIIIDINSPGGSVTGGVAVARLIEQSDVPVICVVDGFAQSIAFYFLQSCDVRLMTPRSTLMVHNAYLRGLDEDEVYTETKLENLIGYVRSMSEMMLEHEAAHMKLSRAELRARIAGDKNWYLMPWDAVKYGAVDHVVFTASSARAYCPGGGK